MTLTEFLLARIAEDEAEATNWLRFEVRDGIPGNYAIKDRVLAECEAKRRIMEDHDMVHECPSGPNLVSDPDHEEGSYGGPCGTLRHLASIYADHPDCRQEWKP